MTAESAIEKHPRDDNRPLVLVIDDDADYLKRTTAALSSSFRVMTALNGQAGLDRLCDAIPAAVVVDQRMPGRFSGLDVLERTKAVFPDVSVIMVSKFLDEDVVRGAMKRGADAWLSKKVDAGTLMNTIEREIQKALHFRKLEILQRRQEDSCVDPVFESRRMREIRDQLDLVKNLRETVLLTGETGTGKTVLADWMHRTSVFADHPYVSISLPVLNAQVVESELFGHEKGAFTDANVQRMGWLEKANNGTVVLEEIGDLPLDLQPKLLNAIERHSIQRMGRSETIRLKIRIIACTNRDLKADAERGRFRLDLLARLSRFHFELPPLRDRTEDIAPMVAQFLTEFSREYKKPGVRIDPDAIRFLEGCDWTGNIRGLQDCVGRCVFYAEKAVISVDDVTRRFEGKRVRPTSGSGFVIRPGLTYEQGQLEWEMCFIRNHLRETRGNVTEAAARMGLARETLQKKIKRLGIDRGNLGSGDGEEA